MQNHQDYKQLNSDQLESFDKEYVNSQKWLWFESGMAKYFSGSENIRILDIGGGNGKFIDRVLKSYTHVRATNEGCGVCFLSKMQWLETFKQANLEVLDFADETPWKFDLMKKFLLHLGDVRSAHFWLQPKV